MSVLTRRWAGVGCCLAVWLCAGLAHAQKVNPNGQPGDLSAGKRSRYYVWYADGQWHLRTTTQRQQHEFEGRIHAVGGKIESVQAAKLEDGSGALKDWWRVSGNNQNLIFKLNTLGAIDGFDFALSNDATEVEFNLKIDGEERAEHIYLGQNSKNPPASNFTYRAVPRGN